MGFWEKGSFVRKFVFVRALMATTEPKEIEKEVGEEPEVAVGTDEMYSIYSNKEKWLIVAMVALAGFYRYERRHRSMLSSG